MNAPSRARASASSWALRSVASRPHFGCLFAAEAPLKVLAPTPIVPRNLPDHGGHEHAHRRCARVCASTQNQALSAILFLCKHVLDKELEWLDGVVRAKTPSRLPVVLTHDEVRAVLGELEETT